MSNLDNITQKILGDAKLEAEEIKNKAMEEAGQITSEKLKEVETLKTKLLEKAKLDAEAAKEKIISEATLKNRDKSLLAKQGVMERVFKLAKEKLENLSDEEYKKFVKETIESLALKGTEEIVVQKGRKDLFKDFAFKISDETVESGFEIIDEKTVINYNFNDLIDFTRKDLEGEVVALLFDQKGVK